MSMFFIHGLLDTLLSWTCTEGITLVRTVDGLWDSSLISNRPWTICTWEYALHTWVADWALLHIATCCSWPADLHLYVVIPGTNGYSEGRRVEKISFPNPAKFPYLLWSGVFLLISWGANCPCITTQAVCPSPEATTSIGTHCPCCLTQAFQPWCPVQEGRSHSTKTCHVS